MDMDTITDRKVGGTYALYELDDLIEIFF